MLSAGHSQCNNHLGTQIWHVIIKDHTVLAYGTFHTQTCNLQIVGSMPACTFQLQSITGLFQVLVSNSNEDRRLSFSGCYNCKPQFVVELTSHLLLTLAASIGKHSVTLLHPSVRLSVLSTYQDSPGRSMRRGQHTFRPDSKEH